MRLAIIPARGGSKRIFRKNIRPFCGKPILAYSIETALKSKCFDSVIVSTDDEEIADIAQFYGANVPFKRPRYISDDHTGTAQVIAHAIVHSTYDLRLIKAVCCIYATAPLLQAHYLQEGYDLLMNSSADYSLSITRFATPIQRALSIDEDHHIKMLVPQNATKRSQDLQDTYHDAGQFYWGKTHAWLEEKPIFSPDSRGIILPHYLVQDIDTLEDWKHAEYIYKAIHCS